MASAAAAVDCLCVCVFTTEMGIARLWFLVVGMLWVMCWSGRNANGQGMSLSYGNKVYSFALN